MYDKLDNEYPEDKYSLIKKKLSSSVNYDQKLQYSILE